jgi:LAO/AO transport system kinase
VVIVETVGVGQSETLAAEMTDLFVLLMSPAGGDELQGVKRGIMEIADLILVNKADGDLKPAATRTAADYAGALRLLRKRPEDPEGFPKAMLVSAVEGTGLPEAWDEMQALAAWRRAHGHWDARRAEQGRRWFEEDVRNGMLARLLGDRALKDRMERLGAAVAAGDRTPGGAAAEVLRALEGGGDA